MNEMLFQFMILIAVIFLSVDIIRRAALAYFAPNRAKLLRTQMRLLTKKTQPRVTVLIYGRADSYDMKATWRTVRASNYTAYDIVAAFSTKSATDAYRSAYRKSKKGEIVICLEEGETIDCTFIKRAVLLRNDTGRWWVASGVVPQDDGLVGIAYLLQSVLWGDSKTIEVCTASALRRTPPVIRRVRGVPYFFAGLMVAAAVLAVMYAGLSTLWYIWLLLTIYFLAVIWMTTGLSLSHRLWATYAAPSAFFFVPLTSLFEVISRLGVKQN